MFYVAASLAAEPPFDREGLVRAVLEQNPSLAAAQAESEAADVRPVQARAWDDPMLSYMAAPASLGGDFGNTVRLSQRLPFPGTRALAAEALDGEADATRGDATALRLRLAAEASQLFDAHVLAVEAITLSHAHRALLEELRVATETRFRAGQGSLADSIQAEQALAMLERDRIGLEAERASVVARLNGLLHRPTGALLASPALPVAPVVLPQSAVAPPELAAAAARTQAAEAMRDADARERFPGLEVMGEYSSMWDEPMHQWTLGVAIEVPLHGRRRTAAVDEAAAMLRAAEAELAAVGDEVAVAAVEARLAYDAARAGLALTEARLVPLARARLAAATDAWRTGGGTFVDVIDAARMLRDAELELALARATTQQTAAELARASGFLPIGGTP